MHKFVLGAFAVASIPLVMAALWEALVLVRAFRSPASPGSRTRSS